MTWREAREEAVRMLKAAGIENAAAESLFLLEAALGANRSFYLLHEPDEMGDDGVSAYLAWTKKRCRHIPLQHLTGEQEFMGLSFAVNEHVMIPRQDTEILVEEALRLLTGDVLNGKRVLDLCTGSGCIAVSIASLCPETKVCASDLSGEALRAARGNAERNGVTVEFTESDLFSRITGKFDLILSNPPYIPSGVIETLMPEVRDHEPRMALDGRADGLHFYRAIIAESGNYLVPGGWLLFEIGCEQGADVSAMMRKCDYVDVEVIPDLAGLDRVVRGRRKPDV